MKCTDCHKKIEKGWLCPECEDKMRKAVQTMRQWAALQAMNRRCGYPVEYYDKSVLTRGDV